MKKNSSTSRRLQEILADGTPRQKALLICKDFLEPQTMEMYGGKPLLTEGEAKGVVNSLYTDTERRQYNKWIEVFHTYLDLLPFFGLGFSEYEKNARLLAGYLYLWEAYDQETDLINTLLDSVEEKPPLIKALLKKKNSVKYARLKQGKEDYFYIDVFEEGLSLYELIKDAQKKLIDSYIAVKALIIVIDKFTSETKSKAFLPRILEENIQRIKDGYLPYNIPSRYSRKELRLRKERGEKITEMDEKKALYPEYSEIETIPEQIEFCEEKLANIRRYNSQK